MLSTGNGWKHKTWVDDGNILYIGDKRSGLLTLVGLIQTLEELGKKFPEIPGTMMTLPEFQARADLAIRKRAGEELEWTEEQEDVWKYHNESGLLDDID